MSVGMQWVHGVAEGAAGFCERRVAFAKWMRIVDWHMEALRRDTRSSLTKVERNVQPWLVDAGMVGALGVLIRCVAEEAYELGKLEGGRHG